MGWLGGASQMGIVGWMHTKMDQKCSMKKSIVSFLGVLIWMFSVLGM